MRRKIAVTSFVGEVDWLPLLWLMAAAVLEELVFRGGVQEALLRFRSNRFAWPGLTWLSAANLLTAIVFASAHGFFRAGWLAVAAFPAALLLGWIYERRRNLWFCIAVHGLMNLSWFVLAPSLLKLLPISVLHSA